MSAPDTNVERQEDTHKPALLGIRGALIFGFAMILLMVIFTFSRGEDPSAETLIGSEAERVEGERPGAGVAIDTYAPGTNETN
ncbi:hypothetical protein AB2B41_05780 [Marimonas sp. MJW-29]|uniref:Uncharacterized protein n=1 Tax=Sulfitobacter sediminis TaxID=3234186 RepID=A0ABV3RJG9_9RHOB